ncbi:putative heat shock protein HSP 90-beta-3 [Galemys pyrenaicus]|uniref:Putative heat shock protein HSP 90-beta-3 n=1 Tax=Galemys pyrenaicus TaxID=202257 RepID=A0A8J5ZUU2_GALPY|nr:putative heat shock protein HSP 90-beta-3 [Galemys pyrenaicus]
MVEDDGCLRKCTLEEAENFAFQVETSQVTSVISNTFYSNEESLLQEQIGNTSDAFNKICSESLTDPSKSDSEKELKTDITPNPQERAWRLADTGNGMTKADLGNH